MFVFVESKALGFRSIQSPCSCASCVWRAMGESNSHMPMRGSCIFRITLVFRSGLMRDVVRKVCATHCRYLDKSAALLLGNYRHDPGGNPVPPKPATRRTGDFWPVCAAHLRYWLVQAPMAFGAPEHKHQVLPSPLAIKAYRLSL
jgi:hypothetical protein